MVTKWKKLPKRLGTGLALKLLKKKPPESRTSIPRIKKSSTSELVQWADVTIMEAGRAFDSWRYKEGPLEEVRNAALTLEALVSELSERDSLR